jgi:hypothetical protein
MDYCQKVFSIQKEVEGKTNVSCLKRAQNYHFLALCMHQVVEAEGQWEAGVGVFLCPCESEAKVSSVYTT